MLSFEYLLVIPLNLTPYSFQQHLVSLFLLFVGMRSYEYLLVIPLNLTAYRSRQLLGVGAKTSDVSLELDIWIDTLAVVPRAVGSVLARHGRSNRSPVSGGDPLDQALIQSRFC